MNYGKSILKRFGSIANIDLSNYVQKVTGKSLIADSEISRLANVTGGTLTPEQLAAIAAQVPAPAASAITQDTTHRFTTDSEKSTWGAKVGTNDPRLTDARNPTSHTHPNDHVPGSDDQDLSDYVLTGDSRLTDNRIPVTHSHAASDITGTVVLTNDARLTDAREPTTHGHALPPEAVLTDDPRLWDARTPVSHTHPYEPVNSNIQAHISSAHAPLTYPAFNSVYRTILDSTGSHIAAKTANTYGIPQGNPLAVTGTGTIYALNTIYIAAADYPTIDGKAPKLRVRCVIACNDVAPFTGTFVIGLHPVTRPATSGGAGLCIYTIGAAVSGSTVTGTNLSADSLNNYAGADFALPNDGFYVLAVVTSATMATSSHCHISASLQIRNN